jgi:hypothetical protein
MHITARNLLNLISDREKQDILSHMRNYHGGPSSDSPSFTEFSFFFPGVFEKIAENLECYHKELEVNQTIEK